MNNETCGCGSEEKTSSAKGIVRINYKEDFELVVELLAGDKPYKLGDEDFRIDFMVMASRYTVGRTGGVCERCSVDGNKIRCFMDGHGLPPGELRAEVKVNTPDPNYADGKRLSVAIADGTVVLVKDNTRFDGAVIKANIPVALVDAYQLAKEHGYKGTIDEYYATFTDVGQLKENIKGTLDKMTKAEKLRADAEKERDKAETERQRKQDGLNTAEGERVKNEQQRQTNEQQRQTNEQARQKAERLRVQQETARQQAENTRVKDEQQRTDNETKRLQAERERVQAENARSEKENERTTHEQARTDAEKLRAKAETKRVSAEQLRVEAETKRVETEKEIKSTLEYVNAQKYIKENEYEREVKAIEAIKNAPKDPTQDVWLDATDGEIKSGPATGNLTKNAITYYYLGKRVIKGAFYGATREGAWKANDYLRHLDVRNWDMTLCTDAGYKFYRYSSLVSLDTSNWNLSALINGEDMFSGCTSLQSLDTSGWNLSALTNGGQMFSGCTSLQSLDTSGWNLSALANGEYMFYGCSSLQTLDFRKSTFRNVVNFDRAFVDCVILAELWLPLTFDKLTTLDLCIPSWGNTDKGLASLRWTFGEGADDRTAKGLPPCTVRLDRKVYDRLTDNERAAAAKKGWTITK
ncbi:BspA family leucine-rich repeat surface protein [Hoylesella buccalis]|uniref:Uncharacterized protein n=1 Tax=Hoylesella buccalis DNF00853 TaxID=1401074 RepID=A0A096BIF7_9BACT|nr:BspA family leucine-rich repeat surface protein [Hoylesella buccalis]KGF32939.1 hypothetical protein HMPREF2137_12465 [Hoylesella buccalis DNF00853]